VLRVQDSSPYRALVQFDPVHLAAVVDEGALLSATLELFIEHNADNWGSSGRSVDAHRLTEDWDELGATWQCANDADLSNALPDCATQWPGGSVLAGAPDSVLHTNQILRGTSEPLQSRQDALGPVEDELALALVPGCPAVEALPLHDEVGHQT
jgi:hypothetical protein